MFETPNLGIRLHDTEPGTLKDRFDFARAQGFGCAHLALSKTLGPSFIDPAPLTPGVAAYVKRSMGDMDVTVLGCYLNLTHPDESVYAETLKKYVAHLRFSRWMGAGMVGTETGNPNADYRYDPEHSHSDAALEMFLRRFEPVVRAAEKLGAIIAIEPVYTHIVWCPKAARRVLDAMASPNLGIILDPVNMLHADNLDRRDELIAEATELLKDEILTVHLKDYRREETGRPSHAVIGQGEMDYGPLFRFLRKEKPGIGMTLEDTTPADAEGARRFLAEKYAEAAEE